MHMRDFVCSRFCRYFKPSKYEGLACMGYTLAERLYDGGMKFPTDLRVGRPTPGTADSLFRNMCGRCPFHKEDCDYASELGRKEGSESSLTDPVQTDGAGSGRDENPPPCGGFIFLGILLEEGLISIDDIANMV